MPPLPDFQNNEFEIGDLVELHSMYAGQAGKAILFNDVKEESLKTSFAISAIRLVPNGTIAFLLEDYDPSTDKIFLSVLVGSNICFAIAEEVRYIHDPKKFFKTSEV